MATTAPTNPIADHFQEQGYYLAKGVFSPAEVAELESAFDRIVAQLLAGDEHINATWSGPEMERLGAAGTVVFHTHNVQCYSEVWLRAMQHKGFLDVAEAILGPDIILHHSKLFQKPSEKGAPFPMHQDWDYFPTIKDSMIAGVIHVSRATDEMGCLRVVPGSHKLGRLDQAGGQWENEILKQHPLESAVPVEAEPGDAVFFHYFTLHGSMPNRSSEVRKTVLVQLHSGDDEVEPGVGHPNAKLVLRGWNHCASRGKSNDV